MRMLNWAILLLVAVMLSACGPSKVELAENACAIARNSTSKSEVVSQINAIRMKIGKPLIQGNDADFNEFGFASTNGLCPSYMLQDSTYESELAVLKQKVGWTIWDFDHYAFRFAGDEIMTSPDGTEWNAAEVYEVDPLDFRLSLRLRTSVNYQLLSREDLPVIRVTLSDRFEDASVFGSVYFAPSAEHCIPDTVCLNYSFLREYSYDWNDLQEDTVVPILMIVPGTTSLIQKYEMSTCAIVGGSYDCVEPDPKAVASFSINTINIGACVANQRAMYRMYRSNYGMDMDPEEVLVNYMVSEEINNNCKTGYFYTRSWESDFVYVLGTRDGNE